MEKKLLHLFFSIKHEKTSQLREFLENVHSELSESEWKTFINYPNPREDKATPIFYAAGLLRFHQFKLLAQIDEVELGVLDKYGNSMIMKVIENARVDKKSGRFYNKSPEKILKMLIDTDQIDLSHKNLNGKDARVIASVRGNKQALEMLGEKTGKGFNFPSVQTSTIHHTPSGPVLVNSGPLSFDDSDKSKPSLKFSKEEKPMLGVDSYTGEYSPDAYDEKMEKFVKKYKTDPEKKHKAQMKREKLRYKEQKMRENLTRLIVNEKTNNSEAKKIFSESRRVYGKSKNDPSKVRQGMRILEEYISNLELLSQKTLYPQDIENTVEKVRDMYFKLNESAVTMAHKREIQLNNVIEKKDLQKLVDYEDRARKIYRKALETGEINSNYRKINDIYTEADSFAKLKRIRNARGDKALKGINSYLDKTLKIKPKVKKPKIEEPREPQKKYPKKTQEKTKTKKKGPSKRKILKERLKERRKLILKNFNSVLEKMEKDSLAKNFNKNAASLAKSIEDMKRVRGEMTENGIPVKSVSSSITKMVREHHSLTGPEYFIKKISNVVPSKLGNIKDMSRLIYLFSKRNCGLSPEEYSLVADKINDCNQDILIRRKLPKKDLKTYFTSVRNFIISSKKCFPEGKENSKEILKLIGRLETSTGSLKIKLKGGDVEARASALAEIRSSKKLEEFKRKDLNHSRKSRIELSKMSPSGRKTCEKFIKTMEEYLDRPNKSDLQKGAFFEKGLRILKNWTNTSDRNHCIKALKNKKMSRRINHILMKYRLEKDVVKEYKTLLSPEEVSTVSKNEKTPYPPKKKTPPRSRMMTPQKGGEGARQRFVPRNLALEETPRTPSNRKPARRHSISASGRRPRALF